MTCTLLLISAAGLSNLPDNVLLDFSAAWCGPCRQMAPTVDRLARQGLPVRKVDVDRHPALARKFGVRGIPAFVLVINGREADRSVGLTSERRLRQMLARIPKPALASKSPVPPKPPLGHAKLKQRAKRRFQLPLVAKDRGAPARRAAGKADDDGERPVVRANLDVAGERSRTAALHKDRQQRPADPMEASVRIRVRDKQGINYGSGTVISSRGGKSIVLTCGHIFRGTPQDAKIEVDVFARGRRTGYVGRTITYDLKADVGLLEIATPEPIPTVAVADSAHGPEEGDRVYSIGCGGGSAPSKMDVQVTALNRYLGPDNVECSGVPRQGRSGGGLFDRYGRLIGVCFAADPPRGRGLYAGLRPIHDLLGKAGVRPAFGGTDSSLVEHFPQRAEKGRKTPADNRRRPAIQIDQRQLALMQVSLPAGNRDERTEDEPTETARPPMFPAELDETVTGSRSKPRQSPRVAARGLSGELKTVDELFAAGEAEVVCIIRPLDSPQAASQVVVINRASAKFVRYLRNELTSQPQRTAKFLPAAELAADARGGQTDEPLVTPFRTVTERHRVSLPVEPGRYRRSPQTR